MKVTLDVRTDSYLYELPRGSSARYVHALVDARHAVLQAALQALLLDHDRDAIVALLDARACPTSPDEGELRALAVLMSETEITGLPSAVLVDVLLARWR